MNVYKEKDFSRFLKELATVFPTRKQVQNSIQRDPRSGLDACYAIAPPIFKMLEYRIHRDPGTRNVLGILRDYEGMTMKDAMGISVRIL